MTKKVILLVFALGATLTLSQAAWADAIQLSSAAAMSAGDQTLVFSGAIGRAISSPGTYPADGNTVNVAAAGGQFELDQVGNNFFGSAFSNGTIILFGAGFRGSSAPLTVNFATPVKEVGMNAEEFAAGNTIFTFSVFNGATLLGTFTANGNDPNLLSFEGVRARNGSVITSLVLSDNRGNDIGAGPVTFATALVPEPGVFLSLAIGLTGLGLTRRRRSPRPWLGSRDSGCPD